MIRKPKRINVRFTEAEYDSLIDVLKYDLLGDITNLTRRALFFYRDHIIEKFHPTPKPEQPAPRQTMPALSDKDKRQARKKPAAKVKKQGSKTNGTLVS